MGLLTNVGVGGMLDGKDFGAVDWVFSFVAAFTYRATGFVAGAPMNGVHMTYTELVPRLMKN